MSSKKPATVPFSASIVRWKQANQVHPPKITAKHKPTHSQLIASKEATSNSSPHSKASTPGIHIHHPKSTAKVHPPSLSIPFPSPFNQSTRKHKGAKVSHHQQNQPSTAQHSSPPASKKEPGEGSEEGSLEVKPQGSSRARQRSDDTESTGTRSPSQRRRPASRRYNPSLDRTQSGNQSTISPQPIRNSTVEP